MDRALPRLQAILDIDAADRAGWAPVDLASAFLSGGARLIQVRAKQLASGPLLDIAEQVVHRAMPFGCAVIVNDRADIARMAGAAGVHVGQDDLPVEAARQLLGAGAIVGYSTHTLAQIEAAARLPVTYIAVGPVFGTTSKDTGYDAVGLDRVRQAVERAPGIPIVGIGGITLVNAASVLAAGAQSVAVISDLLVGAPAARVTAFLAALTTPSNRV